MKSASKILTLIALQLLVLKVQAQVKQLIAQLHQPADRQIMVVSHRGDWRNAPENSLEAYQLAIDMGVDMIEIDLAKTSDGELVIMHDQTIDRTTNGKGKPSDYTLAEIKKLRLRNGLSRVTKHTVPTFEEVMLLARGKVLVNLDKSLPFYGEAYAILKKTGTLDQAVFKSEVAYPQLKDRYGDLLDSITYMAVVDITKPDARQVIDTYQSSMKPVAFEMNFRNDTIALLKNNSFIPARGARIWYNSLWASLNAGHEDDLAFSEGNTKDSWEWLISHGATILQTDRPKELLEFLREKHLHR